MIVCKSGRLLLLLCMLSGAAAAQDIIGDARKIGMGGIGASGSIAPGMAGEPRPYRALVLPLGLIQLYQDRGSFDPDRDDFNPLFAVEYAGQPLHYGFGRASAANLDRLVADLVNGTVDRDLNAYRGQAPVNSLRVEGLAAPNWGKLFKVSQHADGAFHGFYAGAGPYLAAGTDLKVDRALTEVLASAAPVPLGGRSFDIAGVSRAQVALALTGGYRGRIPWPGRSRNGKPGREGLYLGVNYNYLHGFLYRDADIRLRLDTDSDGLLTILPATTPLAIDCLGSRSGDGFAIDLGLAAVTGRWDFGFGVNGIANRITWREPSLKQYTLQSLVTGIEVVGQSLPAPSTKFRVELPVNYTGSAAFHMDDWTVVAEVSHGFDRIAFRGGIERRLGAIDLRGGGHYSFDRWHPSAGLGLNFGRRFSLDVAAFGTSINIERRLRPAVALSVRLNRAP